MADTPLTPPTDYIPQTETSPAYYGPDLVQPAPLPTAQSYPMGPTSLGEGEDPFANLYSQFKSDSDRILSKQDYGKQAATIEFPAEEQQFEKWYQSWDYTDKGFIPWRNNQEIYDADTNVFKELYRSSHYMGPLFFDGFMSGIRTFPDMLSGMFTGDWEDFFGEDMVGALKQDRAYKMGTSTAGGFSTFATGLGIAASNMMGTLVEAGAETALLAFITGVTEGGAAPETIPAIGAKWTKVGATIANGFKNIMKATEVFTDANKMRQAYKNFNVAEKSWQATKGFAKFLNPAKNMTEYGLALYKGENAFDVAKGFGAFYRDFNEIKFALGEAKLEGGSAKIQLQDDLTNKYMLENNGNLPDYETATRIGEAANAAGDITTKVNLPVIFYSNHIGFGNMFKGMPTLNKMMAEASDQGLFKYITFNGSKEVFEEAIGGLSFKQAFRSGIGGIANYTKANFMEGAQELAQEVISGSATEYYRKQFDNASYGGIQAMKGDVLSNMANQVSGQGLSTFLGGFVMGALPGAGMKGAAGLQGLYYRITDKEGWKDFKDQRSAKVKEYVDQLNEVYKDPLKFFDYEMINAGRQGEFGKFMTQAALNKNDKAFYDIKNEQAFEHLYTVYKSGKLGLFKDKIEALSKLTDDELKEAIGFDAEDPKVLRERMQDIIKKADYIQDRYDAAEEKFKNPVNMKAYKKDTPEYANAALQLVAFENARKQAIFAGYSFDRNAERMLSILKDVKDVKVLANGNFIDFNVITNPKFYDAEIATLTKEIATLKQGDEDSKKLAASKQAKLDALKKWKAAMSSKGSTPYIIRTLTDPATGKQAVQNQVNPDHEAFRTKAKEAFKNYVDMHAAEYTDMALNEGIDTAFNKFMDYHALYQEQPNLMKAVNLLADPKNFLNLYESHLEEVKKIYAQRDQILKDGIEKALAITDENNLMNQLAKLGFIVDPKDPDKYYKVSGDTFELVKKGSKEEKMIKELIENHKKATEKESEKRKKEEEAKKKAEKEKKKEGEGKQEKGGKKEKKEKKSEEEEGEEEIDEEEKITDEEGTFDPQMDYVNDHFGITPRKINYKVKYADNGQIEYATWSFAGSKEAPNVEKSVNTIADLESILKLKALMDYLSKVQKVYKVSISDTQVFKDKNGLISYEYKGVIPGVFTKTEELPFFYSLLSEGQKLNFDEGFTSEDVTELKDLTQKDFKDFTVGIKAEIAAILDNIRREISNQTAAMKEARTVDKKFIKSAVNVVKVFTMGEDAAEHMRNVVTSMSKEEILSKMTGKVEKIKPGPPKLEFDETKNKVRLKVYRQSPAVSSSIKVDGKLLGYPTHPDVYIFEIDGVKKTANELTKKEFYLFAQEKISYEEYMSNYNNSMAVYTAFANILDDNKSVEVTNEELQKIFDITPMLGEYDFTKTKIPLSQLEKNGIKLIGVIDKNDVSQAIIPGSNLTERNNNRAIINNYINALELDPATGEIKQFSNQARYMAVFTLPNGRPAFVEVTSPNLEEDELDTLYSDIASTLQKTYKENVILNDKTGMIDEVIDQNFNSGFTDFSKESGRMPFFIAIPQNKENPTALSYKVTLTVTANGSIVVQYVNTQSKDKEYHKAYVEVKYDQKGNPDIENFTDMLAKVNAEIISYNTENKNANLPTLKQEYFKGTIAKPDKVTFAEISKQVTNVSEDIFLNPHMLFSPSSTATPDVDASTKKTGKKTGKEEVTEEVEGDLVVTDESRQALRDIIALTDSKDVADFVANGDWNGEGDFAFDSNGNVVLTRFADSKEGLTKSGKITSPEKLSQLMNNYGGEQIPTSAISGGITAYQAAGGNVTGTYRIPLEEFKKLLKEGYIQFAGFGNKEFVLSPHIASKYLTEIDGKSIEQPKKPATKQGGFASAFGKVNKEDLRKQASSENTSDKPDEDTKSPEEELTEQFEIDKQNIKAKFSKDNVVTDAAGYAKEMRELTNAYNVKMQKLAKKGKLKISETSEFNEASVEDINKFKNWMKKVLPSIDVDADTVAENLANNRVIVGRFLAYVKMTANGSEITGSIQTSAEAAFKYHEAFHAVFTLFLNDEQIDNLLSLARYEVNNKLKAEGKTLSEEVEKMRSTHPMYAEMTTEQLTERYLEEYLADEFDKFKMDQSAPGLLAKIRQFFANLMDFISVLLGKQSEIRAFYKSIDKGKFANTNVQSNRFTKELALLNNPVIEKYKIKYGYKSVKTINGKTIWTPKYVSESDTQRIVGAVVNSFLHRTEKMPEFNKASVLDGILHDMMNLYEPGPKYNGVSVDKLDRLMMFSEIFSSMDARDDIKKSANVFLDLMGYTQDLSSDLEVENILEDEGDRAIEKYGEKFYQGGFKSFTKYARQYIQSTTYESSDEFGNQYLDEQTQEPLAFGVNAGIIYNGMVKLMSGVTTEDIFIQRLLHFRNAGSKQTVAFINKFLEDTGISEESGWVATKDKRLFNAIYKPFTMFNVSYRSYLIDPTSGKSKSIRANMRDAASNQYNQWQNDFNSNYQDRWTAGKQRRVLELITSINDGLSNELESITDDELAEKAKDLRELEELSGLKIVFEYYKYSVLATLRENNLKEGESPLTKDQINFVKSFEGIPILLAEDLEQIKNTLKKKESPFITFDDVEVDNTPSGDDTDDNPDSDTEDPEEMISEDEKAEQAVEYEINMNKGNRSRLMRIAEGNSMFDETVLSSSWLNSEFQTVSSHQLPSYHLAYLEDVIKNPIALEELIKKDPFLMDSYIGQEILNNGDFKQMLNRLRIDRIDGITAKKFTELKDGTSIANNKLQVNKRDGITYGKFNDREFLLTNLLMYLEDQEKMRKSNGEYLVSSRHLIRVIESKSTGDTIPMPVIPTVNGVGNKVRLSKAAEKIILQEFMAEFNRIARVWKDRENPERDILDNYNDFDNPNSQLRGIKFRTFEDFLGTKKAEEYRQLAMSDNPKLNQRQEEEIIKLASLYLLGDPASDIPGLVDRYIRMLDEAGIVSITGDKVINVMLPAEMFGVRMKTLTDRMQRGHLGNDFRANMAQFFINDYLNTISINKLYHGDQAISLIDFVDSVKRAAGSAGAGHNVATSLIEERLGITHSHQHSHLFTHIDPIYEGKYSKSKKQKWADAQTWSTVKTARYNAFGLGRLDEYKARIFDKLERGVPLTAEEVFGVNGTIENNAQLKVEKLVYFGEKTYIKTSVFFLTKELTSQLKLSAKKRIAELTAKSKESKATENDYLEQIYAIQRDNNNWIARPGRKVLHDKRVEMEKFQDQNATTVYSVPVSASKMMKRNVSQSLEDFSISQKQAQKIDNRYMRLQLENTTNKKGGINDSTQMQTIIDAEQNPNTKVTYKGKADVKIKDVIKEYQEAIAQKAKVSYLLARNNIFGFAKAMDEYEISVKAGEFTPKLAKFQKNAIENLKKTGASQQLLEFFELETDPETGEETPAYDLNSPYTRRKYEQLFLSYFRRDVLQQKTPGQALTLTSDYGAEPLKRAKRIIDGKVVEWEVVRVEQQEASGKEYRPMSDRALLENKVSIEEANMSWEDQVAAHIMGESIPRGIDDYEFFHKNIDDVTEVGQLFTDRLRHNWPVYNEAGEIIGYKTEFMMPHHFRETMEIGPNNELPEDIIKAFAARIPGQDKHSAASTDLVDFLPAHYGSMAMLAREVAEISGADNDVDKAYTQFSDFYVKRDKQGKPEFIQYGTATEDVDRFVEYFLWNITNNKILKDEVKSIKEEDEDYKKILDLLDKLYSTKEHIIRYKVAGKEYIEELREVDRAITILSKTDNIDEPADDWEEGDYIRYKNLITRGHAAEFVKEKILRIEYLINDVSKEVKRADRNINFVISKINEIKREKNLLERVIQMEAMEKLHLPTTVETFLDFEYDMDGEVNIGALNNTILEAKRVLLTNDYMQEDGKAFEVADQGVLEDLEKDKDIAPYLNPDSTIDNDNQVGKTLGQRNNQEGSRNIGSVVNGQMSNTFLMKNAIRFRRKDSEKSNQVYILKIDDTEFDSYEHHRKALITDNNEVIPNFKSKETKRIMYTGSGYVSAMTDNAKDRRSAKFSLNINAAAIAMDLNGRGVPDKLIIALLLNKTVQKYYRALKKEKYAISTNKKRESKKLIASKIIEQLEKKLGGKDKAIVKPLTTNMLLDGLSNPTAETDLSIFHHFLQLEKQNEAFSTLAQILKLTKGPTADMHDWDNLVEDAYENLGIGMTEEQFQRSDIPFDVRKLVTETSPIISMYWKINGQIHDEIGKTVLISRSKLFRTTKDAVLNQLDVNYSLKDKVQGKLENHLIMYYALRGYIKNLRTFDDELLTLLDNNLVYGTHKGSENISDIIKKARINNPNNYLIKKYLRLVPKTVMQGEKEIVNKDNKKKIHMLEPSTYGVLDDYMMSKIHDSYMDLYENDRKAALAIFAYCIIKDATLFSPNGIMHIFPPHLFKDLMGETMFDVGRIFKNDDLDEYLSQGENATKFYNLFGGSFKEVVAEFMEGYLRHIENKYHLKTFAINIPVPDKQGKLPPALPIRFTAEEGSKKTDREQIIINLFTGVTPTKIKYKKKKAQENPDDAEESNLEESALPKYKLGKDAKDRLLKNISDLKKYKLFTTSDDDGNIGLKLPYTFKVPGAKGGFDVYVLQNISKVADQDKMKNVPVVDVLTNNFDIVAPTAIYKLVETDGAYGTTPIGNVFGEIPSYSQVNNPELAAAERKRLSEIKPEEVEEDEDDVETDLDVSTPDKPFKRPSNQEEDEEEPVAQKRDVAFLKSKGITVTLKGGEYIYKKNGKVYEFNGSPRDLADFFDEDGSFKDSVKTSKTGKKQSDKKKKFYDPAYTPRGSKGKKTAYIPKVDKLDLVEDEDITQKMIDKILEEETESITHYDGKKFLKVLGPKFNQYGTYKTKIEGQSAINLIRSGVKTEINIGSKDTVRDINELFVMEDTEPNSPTYGEKILLRATTAPYKSNKSSFNKHQGWDSSVWEGRKDMINKYNELSFRFEYVGDIVDGELVLPEETVERSEKKVTATATKTKETKKETPSKLPTSAFKNDTFEPKVGSIQETITDRLEEVMSDTALEAGYLKKEQYKSKRATQFIGEGAVNKKGEDSSTERYRKLYDEYDLANTGDYTSDDMIWVSVNGNRGSRVPFIKDGVLNGEFKNITAAIKAGASFIMDTAEHIAGSKYNIGEVEAATYLTKKGYVRDDKTGIWTPKPKTEKSETIPPVKSFSSALGKIFSRENIEAARKQAATENTPDEPDKDSKFEPGTRDAAKEIDKCGKTKKQ